MLKFISNLPKNKPFALTTFVKNKKFHTPCYNWETISDSPASNSLVPKIKRILGCTEVCDYIL